MRVRASRYRLLHHGLSQRWDGEFRGGGIKTWREQHDAWSENYLRWYRSAWRYNGDRENAVYLSSVNIGHRLRLWLLGHQNGSMAAWRLHMSARARSARATWRLRDAYGRQRSVRQHGASVARRSSLFGALCGARIRRSVRKVGCFGAAQHITPAHCNGFRQREKRRYREIRTAYSALALAQTASFLICRAASCLVRSMTVSNRGRHSIKT